MQIGLVGLPQTGKTTFFNLMTGLNLPTGYHPAAGVHTASVAVSDKRIDHLASLYKRKAVYARIIFKDIPGVKMNESRVRAAKLLDEARTADALVQVIRAFPGSDGGAAPYRDVVDYATELMLADIDALEKRIERIKSRPKIKKDALAQLAVLERLLHALEQEQPLDGIEPAPGEQELLAGQAFLSEKPLIYAINLDENRPAAGDYPQRGQLMAYAKQRGIPVIEICARVEMEIGRLSAEERDEFMAVLGLSESGLDRLARTAYERLGLISFFTVGDDEVRAWTVCRGATARQAAGKVHSDMERGFIRAEVFHFDDLFRLGSAAKVKEAGLFRLEGRDYQVRDGEIITVRFNV